MNELTNRRRQDEWMDAVDVDPAALDRSLRFIRRVNVLFGYTRATISHLRGFSRGWKPDEPITILDVATGSADIPRAVLRWARKRRLDVRIVGLDRHASTARLARDHAMHDPAIRIVRGDALELPFADGSFDYAMTNMFLHHLDDPAVEQALGEMDRVARRGIIAADLVRDRRAHRWIRLLTLLANPMVRHDARVSVEQAFTRPEVLGLRDRAGIGYADWYSHFGYRFVLAGEKEPLARHGTEGA